MADLTQQQWREQLEKDDNAIILDVRTEAEVEEGYIPNAKHLDIMNAGSFMDGAKELDPSKNYYVYCKAGGRSAQACMILNSIGYNNTFNLMGGFSQWNGETTM
ncbi:rhodanese [Patiriisocius marinistellae]|uniref:Rhodanese n=1 Tax=Patiriisocius marinistellae TaxID=2494560 RepID=A0A5J4FYX0_9FLAO|nr:rhodanese-like domain-containing protein [Patiriisocius marinistellae]GEQ87283.1 rhodanese [Patiriisocius marinistellae]